MPEMELEPDRNRLHELVRLTWDTAQGSDPGGVAVTDQDVADAGPYSLEQIRGHLEAEEGSTYSLERDGDTLRVLSVT